MKYGNESSLSRIIQNLKRFLDLKADKTEIPTSLSSLSSDSTHRLVTDTEKKTWNSKQSALNSQTAYSNKGSNSKVAKITTNSLGQVTNITEVDINITKSQVSDFPTSMPASDVYSWAKEKTKPKYTASEVGALPSSTTHLSGDIAISEKGSYNGVAELDKNGKVPSSQLPSYVDDVVEGTLSTFPSVGESGKIYVDTSTNKSYRWSGSNYVEISESLALGETSSTAYAGNKGKANADKIANLLTRVSKLEQQLQWK